MPRPSLVQSMQTAKAEAAAAIANQAERHNEVSAVLALSSGDEPVKAAKLGAGMTTTAIHIPRDLLALLRRVAVEQANYEGGRPSVSAVLTDLVEQNRAQLEAKAERRS